MTISSTTNRTSSLGNGVTTAFPFPYKFFDDADLMVYQGGTLKTLTTHYTVSGAGDDAGGSVTFLTAPANDEEVVIVRDPAITQETDLVENDPLPAETLENALDRLTTICQRQSDRVGRSIRLADDDTSGATMILPATGRESKALIFDANGDVTVSTDDFEDQATNAAASAAAASASAASAAASAGSASTSASAASTSATNAATSETNAAASAASVGFTLTSTSTLQNKTLDNTNTITVKDANFTIQDDADTTKQVKLQVSGITTGTTRTYTAPNATGTLPLLELEQTWFAQQTPMNGTLTDGATVNWDGDSNGQVVDLTLGGNRTLAAPTNINNRAIYVLRVTQDGTGSRTLAWNAAYKFAGGTVPTLTTTAGAVDIFTFLGGSSNVLHNIGKTLDDR